LLFHSLFYIMNLISGKEIVMLNRIFRYKRIWLLLLGPLGLLLTLMARADNGWVEGFHAKYIYPFFANTIGWVVSLFPFSLLEFLILAGFAALIYYIVRSIIQICRNRAAWKNRTYRLGLNLMGGLSVLYFCFVLFMGLNYYRDSITVHMELSVRNSTKEELYDLCELLIADCNFYRKQLKEDENGVALLQDDDFFAVAEGAREAYAKLEEEIPVLEAADVRNKPLLTSDFFSMVMTTGIYIPFESGINVEIPETSIPSTMCHELTHFRGFMAEDEANFLGYLACKASDRADFQYSGSLMAFQYTFNALYDEDIELARKIAQMCDEGVLRDIQAEDAYWAQYRDTVISDASGAIYEGYLQSNDQESGLKSYGEMIDLLLAYYRNFNEV